TPPPTPAVRMPPATWNRADTLVLLSWIQLPRQQGTGGEQRRGRRPPRGGRRRRWALGQAPQGAVVGAARAVRPDGLGDRAAGAGCHRQGARLLSVSPGRPYPDPRGHRLDRARAGGRSVAWRGARRPGRGGGAPGAGAYGARGPG